jgi:hypothetical protein
MALPQGRESGFPLTVRAIQVEGGSEFISSV